jgi:hypothetical protein
MVAQSVEGLVSSFLKSSGLELTARQPLGPQPGAAGRAGSLRSGASPYPNRLQAFAIHVRLPSLQIESKSLILSRAWSEKPATFHNHAV